MGWNDLQEPIAGSREELYDRVTTRGRWLRQRRQMTWAAVGVVAVLAAALPAATLVDGERTSSTQVATGAPPDSRFAPATEGLPESTALPSPPIEPLPFPGTTLAPSPRTPTTVRSTAPSPAPAPAPSADPAPGSLTSPSAEPAPGPKPPDCTAGELQMTLTPEKPSWGPSEPVGLIFAVQNRSDHVCGYNASLGLTGYDASGTPAGMGVQRINDYFFGDLVPVAPGQVVSEALRWEHDTCEGSPAICTPLAPGVYRLVLSNGYGVAEATVTLT